MSTSTHIDWSGHGVRRWEALIGALTRPSVEQTWAFGEAIRLHARRDVRRGIVVHNGHDVGLVQAQGRVAGPARFWLIARGPHFIDDLPPDVMATGHRLVREAFKIRQGDFLLWMPEKPDSPQSRADMAALGMRRLVTGYHSGWLDIRDPQHTRAHLHANWLGALKTAEKSGLKTHVAHTGKQLTWLLTQADKHRKSGRYQGTSGAFAHLLAGLNPNRGDVLTLIATVENTPVAGMLFLRHGHAATYYIGWNGEDGRRLNAHHLLLWQAVVELNRRGTQWLDLGGISTDDAPGVARFKLGTNPQVYSLAGVFG
jgi:hypothetical protein